MDLQRRNSIFYSDDEEGGEKKAKREEREEKRKEEDEGDKEEDMEEGYEAMLMEKTQKDEKYTRVAVRAKLSVEVEQKKRLGAWGRRVLVLDGATLYAYKVKGEGGSVGGWSVGGADVHVGKSSDDGRHLLVISRPPAYKLTFSFTTTYEQARMIQALSSSGATVTGLEAIMLLKNLRKQQQQEEEEKKEEERKRMTMEEGLILQTLPYPEDLLRGGGGGTGRDEHKEESKLGTNKEEEADQNKEGKEEKVQQVEEREKEEEEEEEEISQAVYNYMAFSSMFSTSYVTKESANKEEEDEKQADNEAKEQDKKINEDERDSKEERRSIENEMNENDKRNKEEENEVQQNQSYLPTSTTSQPPHTTPSPSTASGGGAGEGQRVEGRVNPLPKPPRVSQVPEGRPTDSKETISSASVPQSTPAGQEGSKVVLEESEGREVVQNGVLAERREGTKALFDVEGVKEGVKESEDEEILAKKLKEESEGVINDNPASDLSPLSDIHKEEKEKEQEQGEREKEAEDSELYRGNSENKEDKSSPKSFYSETVKEGEEDKKTEKDNKEEDKKEEDKKEDQEEDKEQDKDSYSQLVTTMRLDRSFTLDTHAPSSAPSSELSSPSDEAALHSPTSPSSPKSPSMHSPILENTKSSDNEEYKKEEIWASDVLSDSEEQFEKLYNELSKTLNQPSQPENGDYNSNSDIKNGESSVVTPEEPKDESSAGTPEEPKDESTVVTLIEPKEEITVVPLKESDSTSEKTELKRTNSIIKRRDGDSSQSSSSSNKKVQFDLNVQSIDLPPDPPLHDLPQVKENGEARPGVTLIREKTGKNTTPAKVHESPVNRARKIEENKRKTSPSPSSPVRKKPQVSSQVKTTRSVTSGDGVIKKREGSVRTPSPVTPTSPSKAVKKTVGEDKTKKTVSEDKTKKVEKKEEIKKVGKDEKAEDKPGKKEEAKKTTDKEERSAVKKAEEEENKAKTKAEDTKKTVDSKTREEKTETKIKTEAKDEGRKTTTTITTITTKTTQISSSKATEVKGSGPVSNVKRQPTVDLQAPLVISGQVEMGGSIGGRLNARRVEVRDGHILAFISHASTPSSRLPLAGLSVTPMLGGKGGGASLILTRASRCMMVLKLGSREEMMHWIHTLSDEVLRVTPEEHLKGLTLYPSPEQKEEKKEEEETKEEKEEEEEEEEGSGGGKSIMKEEGENVTKEEERPNEEEEEKEEDSEVEEREENREASEVEDREKEEKESSDESAKKEISENITQRKQEKPKNTEEKETKENHSLPSKPQGKQEARPKENGEVEKDSKAKKRILTSPHFMEHLNKFREQQKTEIQVKRAGKDEKDEELNSEGRRSVNRKTGNKLEESITNKIAALIKEAEGRDREAGRERRESVGGRGARKTGREGGGEERDTKGGTEEAGRDERRESVGGREGRKETGKVAGREERDTKAGTEEARDGDEATEGRDTGGEIQVETRKHPGSKTKEEGRIGGLTHPPLRRLSGQGKSSPSPSPLPSPLASPLTSPRLGEDVVDNYLLVNILPEKPPPTTITTTTTTTKATTATTTTTTSTATTTTPKSVHHTTTASSKRTSSHSTTHHHHNHHSTITTPPTNRHANCFKPNDPISNFNRSISASNTSLTHDEGRKAQTGVLKRSTSDMEINKGRKEGGLTRKGAVKIKNTGNRTSKRDRERRSEGDVSESINKTETTLSSVISSRILAAKNIEIIERKDRKGSESEDMEDKENETWHLEERKRAMNLSLRKGEEERGVKGRQEAESNITWSVAATREKFELLCSVSGENKGKLTTKTPISRRRSTRLSQKRRRTQELNSTAPRRQGSVRRSFIGTENDQSNEREGVTRQRSVQSREASIEIEDSATVAEERGVDKGAMRRLGGFSNSTTSQDDEYNQSTQKESARRQGSWPTRDTVQEARKAFERYSTRTTTPTTTDKEGRHDSGIQKEKLTAKQSPLSRTQNILRDSPTSISVSGHEDEEFGSVLPPPFTKTTTAMQSRNDDVVICWRGPYIAQESEQEVLNNISNAFLAKRRLLNKEVAMGRLQGRLHLLEEHLWGLQARLATEEQISGGDRKSVERALRSVEEEIEHVTSRISVVQKEAHQAREKLAAALATGLSQWCDKTGLTPRSTLTRRGKEQRQQDEEEEEEEMEEEESEA